MESNFVLGFTLVSAVLFSPVTQTGDWDLKGLDSVAVEFTRINSPNISEATTRQLDADIKAKFKIAGLTLAPSLQDAKATFSVRIQDIKGQTSEWIEIELLVEEQVQTSSRKASRKVRAVTYLDRAYLEAPKGTAEKEIYDTVLNELVTKFVKDYSDQNSK
jgi:hypothetical protein